MTTGTSASRVHRQKKGRRIEQPLKKGRDSENMKKARCESRRVPRTAGRNERPPLYRLRPIRAASPAQCDKALNFVSAVLKS